MYNDEQILSIDDYEKVAKAYADALRKKGLMIVTTNEVDSLLLEGIFEKLSNIKSYLFMLGGFLNTGAFYSLNERQIKKLSIIFDDYSLPLAKVAIRDKTKCFLSFLSTEMAVIKDLLKIAPQTSFEKEIEKIIEERLSLLSSILSL